VSFVRSHLPIPTCLGLNGCVPFVITHANVQGDVNLHVKPTMGKPHDFVSLFRTLFFCN
jgi:hypothetical protein